MAASLFGPTEKKEDDDGSMRDNRRCGKRIDVRCLGIAMAGLVLLLSAETVSAGDTGLMAVGVRGGISMKGESPLGEQMREDFVGADVLGVFRLPWSWYAASGWGVGTRLITSAGAFAALEKVAFVSSVAPVVALGTRDGRFTVDAGLGGAVVSAHRFGRHDLGGPFQFVATAGVSVAPFGPLGFGYRFQHYSDGTIYGSETRGLDLHMIEITYRY